MQVGVELLSTVKCTHCDSPLKAGDRDGFCCEGCRRVHSILLESGLSRYYELKQAGVCFTPAAPVSSVSTPLEIENDREEVRFFIEGIHCSACLWLLEKLPQILPALVKSCSLNLAESVLTVHLFEPSRAGEVGTRIRDWGYTPHWIRDREGLGEKMRAGNRKSLIELGIAGALMGNIMLMSIPLYSGVEGGFLTLFEWVSFALAIPSLFYSGRSFFRNVSAGIQTRTFPIDGPILLALLIAFFYSTVSLVRGTHQLYFDSLSALIFLLLASRYALSRLRQGAQMNLGALQHLSVKTGHLPGELVAMREPGVFPFDGVVRSGGGWCDRSRFTGESMPVRLVPGSAVEAGTTLVSMKGEITIEVGAVGEETRLSRMLERIREAQNRRTASELRSEGWSKRLLAVVLAVAAIAFGVFLAQGRGVEGVNRILALLIVTCPCALALATPLVFTLAMKRLLSAGLLVKDPSALDRIPEIDRICFDKTGTLTLGEADTSWSPTEVPPQEASILLSLVSRSRHPFSRALERKLRQGGVREAPLDDFQEIPGLGLSAKVSGVSFNLYGERTGNEDSSLSVFTRDGEVLARIPFRDQPRLEGALVVKQLKALGLRPAVLSGDREAVVRSLARELSIPEFRSGMSPEEKAAFSRGSILVGDGVNDALALSGASVSVAVHGGMEAAVESAQVYSLTPGLRGIPELVRVAILVRRTLGANFLFSTTYNLIGAVLSLAGYMSPLLAAVLMPLSALTVFFSSLIRLKARNA